MSLEAQFLAIMLYDKGGAASASRVVSGSCPVVRETKSVVEMEKMKHPKSQALARTWRWSVAWATLAALMVAMLARAPRTTAEMSTQPGKKWALLIGVNDYTDENINDLKYAVKDVKAVAQALQQHAGFAPENVKVMTTDQAKTADTYPAWRKVLSVLDQMGAQVGENDQFFFYFSGHGFQKDNGHFLATADTELGEIEMEMTSVSLGALKRKLQHVDARQFVFVLDACRNDPTKGTRSLDSAMSKDFAEQARDLVLKKTQTRGLSEAGVAYLLACSQGQKAYEDPTRQQGIFTYYMLQGLAGAAADKTTGEVTADSLCRYVQNEVRDWSIARNRGQLQKPDYQTQGQPITLARFRVEPTPTPIPPKRTRIRIESSPPGADVLLNGFEMNELTPCELDVPSDVKGLQMVALKMDGYQAYTKKAQIVKDDVVVVKADLQPEPAQAIVLPTALPIPTATPLPVYIPRPTPRPTATPKPLVVAPLPNVQPTATPRPTPLPRPTATPLPWRSDSYLLSWQFSKRLDEGAVAISASGRFVAQGRDDKILLRDARDGSLRTFDFDGEPALIAFSANAQVLLAADKSGAIEAWSIEEFRQLRKWKSPVALASLAASSDGALAAGGGIDGSVTRWRIDNGDALSLSPRMSGSVTSLSFGDRSLLVAGDDKGTLRAWNHGDNRIVREATIPGPVTAISVAPGEEVVAFGTWVKMDRIVGFPYIHARSNGFELTKKQIEEAIAKRMKKMGFVTHGALQVINLKDGKISSPARYPQIWPAQVVFAPDGQRVMTRMSNNSVAFVRTASMSTFEFLK
jgi:uncharacterized caspase-like protein